VLSKTEVGVDLNQRTNCTDIISNYIEVDVIADKLLITYRRIYHFKLVRE